MTTVTASHANDFGLPPQRENESDSEFRHRIAGILREQGHLIEAHEAQQDARWDDPKAGESVTTGVMGALAQALQGVDYRVSGSGQVGADIAAGGYIKHKKPDMSPEEALLMMQLFGGLR